MSTWTKIYNHLNSVPIQWRWCLVLQKLLRRGTCENGEQMNRFLLYVPLPQDPDACFGGLGDSSWRSLMPSDSQIFVLWEAYKYIYDELQMFAYVNTLYTLKKDNFYIYIHLSVGFYMKMTHCFVNIFHVSYE